MSYEFIKLSEVELVDEHYNANLLIEEDGEIKRLSTENIQLGGGAITNQVQSDWTEKDDTSPAYILNKPSFGNAILFWPYCGGLVRLDTDEWQSQEVFRNYWNSGNKLLVRLTNTEEDPTVHSEILAATFSESSGTKLTRIAYLNQDNAISTYTFYY